MNEKMQSRSMLRKLIAVVLAFGPGIFAIGYTIGAGSVTSMVVAGSRFNMQLLWVLLLSCLFSGLLIYTYGNYSLVRCSCSLLRRIRPSSRKGGFAAWLWRAGTLITARYDPERMKEGRNVMTDGEEVFYISNPALGLWAVRDRFTH